MDVAERVAAGRTARSQVPRSSHGKWQPAGDRPDPVGLLEAQARSRVPELVPIRYGRMAASPFAFFRGAAAVMAADLGKTPVSGLRVQLCGDAHLSNFGAFAAPDRSLVFDLNDFDESLPGPFEWDVKRLAASFEIAGRHRGLPESARRALVLTATASYRGAVRELAGLTNLGVWYSRLDATRLTDLLGELRGADRRAFLETAEMARTKDATRALGKRTEIVDGERR